MDNFRLIVVEDVALELKGTLSIIRSDVPEAKVVGTAMTESELWPLMKSQETDAVLLDLGLGGSTTVGIDICRRIRILYPKVRVLIFTGEVQNEKLWADALAAGAHGIVLKTGELLTRTELTELMEGRKLVFNQPILQRITEHFCSWASQDNARRSSMMKYDIDEYDERFLRHLALGYTKEMISELRTMPFSAKSLEKRQADLINRLFGSEGGVNVTRLVVKSIELHIIDPSNLEADE